MKYVVGGRGLLDPNPWNTWSFYWFRWWKDSKQKLEAVWNLRRENNQSRFILPMSFGMKLGWMQMDILGCISSERVRISWFFFNEESYMQWLPEIGIFIQIINSHYMYIAIMLLGIILTENSFFCRQKLQSYFNIPHYIQY